MEKYIDFQNAQIRCTDKGEGKTLVFLHGYLESLDIWTDFSKKLLQKNVRIITIDLPGHGKSQLPHEIATMEVMAKSVNAVLNNLQVEKCYLFGHSMGGYVTLAFLELFSEKLSGFCLFHSSPFADPPENKKNRDRQIELIKQGKKNLVYNVNIPKTFANDNLEKYKENVAFAKKIAKETSNEGIIAALEGMKQRPDRSQLLKETSIPFLYIIGKKDNFIPFSVLEKIKMPQKSKTVVFENSGHIAFIEEPEKALKTVLNFVTNEIND